jgi:hypothetical protein
MGRVDSGESIHAVGVRREYLSQALSAGTTTPAVAAASRSSFGHSCNTPGVTRTKTWA